MATIGRLHLVTDHRLRPRIPELVAAAVVGGVTGGVDTVQVRAAGTTGDQQALALTRELLGICRQFGATCLVKDRVGIVASDLPTLLAAGAQGAAMVSTFSEAPDPAAVLAGLRAALGPAGALPDDVAAARGLQVAAVREPGEGAWTSR